MAYLYGDATSSPLELNWIRLLRDALDFAVAVLQASQRIERWDESQRDREIAAEAEVERIEALGRRLVEVLEGPAGDGEGTSTGRCANAIAASASATVASEITRIKAALADDLARMRGEIDKERRACFEALEKLLLQDDIPQSRTELRVAIGGDGRYLAKLRSTSPLELETVLDLDIPAGNLFSELVRVDRLMELEIRAPDKRGWLSKKVKLVEHKLSKKVVVELVHAKDRSTLKLRAAPQLDETGFDIEYPADSSLVRVALVHKEGGETLAPYEMSEADSEKLCALLDGLAVHADALREHRRRLSAAALDGVSLSQHGDPALLVRRLVQQMAPVVQEISRHSLQKEEFVLKRALDGERREEIFVPKHELRAKLDPLPAELRRIFDPLGLGHGPPPPPPTVGRDIGRKTDELPTAVGAPSSFTAEPSQVDSEWLDDSEVKTGEAKTDTIERAIRSLESESDRDPR